MPRHLSAALLFSLAFSVSVQAHHSFSAYNRSEAAKKTIQGTVREFSLINPHGWLKIQASEPGKSSSAIWSFEMSSATQLQALGWAANSIKVGSKVDVTYFPLRFGSYGGQMLAVRLPGGKTLVGTAEPDRGYPKPGGVSK